MNLFGSDYHENDQVYKGDFKIPLSVGSSVSGFFKFGGEYRYNYITNDQSTPYIQISGTNDVATQVKNAILPLYPNLRYSSNGSLEGANFTSTNSKLLSSFLSNKFGSVDWATNPTILNTLIDYIRTHSANFTLPSDPTGGGWYNGLYQNLPNDYKYIERYYGGYLMSELDFGIDLMVVGGADLPPKNRSTLKLENFILWIKGGSDEQTKAYSGRDHQQTAGSGGLAGQGNVDRGSDATAGNKRCNVLQVAEGVWRATG
jgi:hypothetical protein